MVCSFNHKTKGERKLERVAVPPGSRLPPACCWPVAVWTSVSLVHTPRAPRCPGQSVSPRADAASPGDRCLWADVGSFCEEGSQGPLLKVFRCREAVSCPSATWLTQGDCPCAILGGGPPHCRCNSCLPPCPMSDRTSGGRSWRTEQLTSRCIELLSERTSKEKNVCLSF